MKMQDFMSLFQGEKRPEGEVISLPDTFMTSCEEVEERAPAEPAADAPEAVPETGGEVPPSSTRDYAARRAQSEAEQEEGKQEAADEAEETDEAEDSRRDPVAMARIASLLRKLERRENGPSEEDRARAQVKRDAIRKALTQRRYFFTEGERENNYFFHIPSMGDKSRRFDLNIQVEVEHQAVRFTAKLPFSCCSEMSMGMFRRYVDVNYPLRYFAWEYDRNDNEVSIRDTIPFWDPALDEQVLDGMLDACLMTILEHFVVLEWLATGIMSQKPREKDRALCAELLEELEGYNPQGHQRMVKRLRLALEGWDED